MQKKNIIIIAGFIFVIILTATITALIVKHNDHNINKANEIKSEESSSKNHDKNEEDNNAENEVAEHNVVKDNDSSESSSESNVESSSEKNNEKKSESDIVSYAEKIESSSTSNTLKEGFVTIIDFLLYDGKIYNKTFSELSNTAKIKVITLALKIDSKIDEYFPGYKESISTTTNKAYTSIKAKLVALYLDTTVKICNNNPTLCENAKANLNDLKETFGITWEFIKDISGVGITKLKDWYEVWKEE